MEHPIHRLIAVASLLAAGALSSCAPPINTQVASSAVTTREATMSTQIIAQVDDYRRQRGASPLQRNRVLDQMARQHSEFLRANRGKFRIYGSNVSHYGVEQRAFAARQIYGIDQLSENVAAAPQQGDHTAAYLVDQWKKSPTHECNLRNAWTSTGVGVVIDGDGTVFATQVFGSRARNSHLSMMDSLRVH